MSNTETAPREVSCGQDSGTPGSVEIIRAREVPLGGPRAMTVRRTLPSRQRSMIGAWCFADHYGPDPVAQTGGMVVPPHPHTGLQTVSWLFQGRIEHRDSLGVHAEVTPGELNLMTAGRGVSHSEVSTPDTTTLHGVQLWLALPDAARAVDPAFERYAPTPHERQGAAVSVFLGGLTVDPVDADDDAGVTLSSPVAVHSPLLGAQVDLCPGAALQLRLDASYEHGVLVDGGPLCVDGEQVERSELAYLAPGRDGMALRAGEHGARVILLGGQPFGEQIVMWWNFIGRDHDEIVAARQAYQAEIHGRQEPTQFGTVDYPGPSLGRPGAADRATAPPTLSGPPSRGGPPRRPQPSARSSSALEVLSNRSRISPSG